MEENKVPNEIKKDPFTEEQRAAIDARGKIIVSASAGSGKTTVMIERIIQLVLGGVGVDEILAVTFTKKAAAQMKEKLSKKLIEKINAEDTDGAQRDSLRAQLPKVGGADISTIHSFCARLIRSHFYLAGVDSAFRVIGGDDADGKALKNEALDDLLEEGYEAQDGEFFHLLSVYWRKKSDKALREIFLDVYDPLRSRADYLEYLEKSCAYDERVFDGICADLYVRIREKFLYYREKIGGLLTFYFEENRRTKKTKKVKGELVETEGDCPNQFALCDELSLWLKDLCAAPDYFAMLAVGKRKFTGNRGGKKTEEQTKNTEILGFLKDRILDAYDGEFGKRLDRKTELERFLQSGKTAAALAKYLIKFDEKYAQLKAERGVLDYNDLEHKALALLKNEDVRAEMRKKYRFVFVDEYQDVNSVQDEIMSLVSGDELFLVGDMKQAIYGFRGSNSQLFGNKEKEFAAIGHPLKMSKNFRSADKVLDAVNAQFKLAMTEKTCGIRYVDEQMNKGNKKYPAGSGKVRVHFVGKEEKEREQTGLGVYSVRDNAQVEVGGESRIATAIRRIIEEETHSDFFDVEAGEFRRVDYKDIAVLSRNKQGRIGETVAALAAAGLPVTTASSVNICEFAEIKTLIDILSLIDNAEQDVPLASALLSAMGGMSADELSVVRLAYHDMRREPFRKVCKRYAEEKTDGLAEKLRAFFAYYENIRTLSRVADAGEILLKILSETGMEARILARENGSASLRRVQRFLEEATLPEPLSVHAFLDRLRDLDYEILYSESGGENAVKVLTMHSSKGLEYPVVILDNLSAHFHAADHDEVIAEEKYGLAPRAFDEKKMCKSQTVLRRLCIVKQTESSIKDELNLYYVAMTRAKHTLHMLFEEKLPIADVQCAKSFAEFTDFSVWEEYFAQGGGELDLKTQERQPIVFHPDEELAQEIMGAFRWKYAHEGYENLPVKSSATRLIENTVVDETPRVGFGAADMKNDLFDGEEYVADAEGNGGERLSASDKELGIAYHAFLENFDFSLLFDENGAPMSALNLENAIQEELAKGVDGYRLLSVSKLQEILSNPIFKEVYGARIYKERQFLASLPVLDTYAKRSDFDKSKLSFGKGEEMIFQGAIDLMAVSADGVRIVDYKYSSRSAAYLRAHYKPQLDLYRLAAAKILGIDEGKVHCVIVNIRQGYQVDMD
ncbi:MAG: UvrD-helicase domain-containing protein [Clostridia bacterium]|nr:UvrD-helicase domain-containing protein [Clostridia bacterium]MBQ7913739.1 UvrD-helicase domain-containing protein [Clostridia bacterium]